MGSWPQLKTVQQLVDEHILPCGEETVRGLAKTYGVGRKLGRAYVFTPADVERLIEALPCPSNSHDATASQTGTSAGLSPAAAMTKALALSTAAKRKKSSPSARRRLSAPASTVIALSEHSQRQR